MPNAALRGLLNFFGPIPPLYDTVNFVFAVLMNGRSYLGLYLIGLITVGKLYSPTVILLGSIQCVDKNCISILSVAN